MLLESMPYVLSAPIHHKLPGLWGEGTPYESKIIYDIRSDLPATPPVHYEAHTLKPHSIPHIDAPGHIIAGGLTVEQCFNDRHIGCFYGSATVVKLRGSKWNKIANDPSQQLWRVELSELKSEIKRVTGSESVPRKLLLTADHAPLTPDGFHDSRFILVLTREAAEWLVSSSQFSAYGTSWKSSDFEPGSRERPIHKILFQRALLFEHLKLDHVPEGIYFFCAFPLLLSGATESPVTPVLFTPEELSL